MKKILSTSLIAIGSFLLGGSLGLYLGDRHCRECCAEAVDDEPLTWSEVMGKVESDMWPSLKDEKVKLDGKTYTVANIDELRSEECKSPLDVSGFQEGLKEYNEQVSNNHYISFEEVEQKAFSPRDKVEIKDPYGKLKEYTKEHGIPLEDVIEEFTSLQKHGLTSGQALEIVLGTERSENEDAIPYIISVDAYLNEFEEYSKNELTYFEGDDVLADLQFANPEVIEPKEEYVGSEALTSFGEGSDDENVVYIRNHKKHADYEIVRESGSFAVDILGFDDEEEYKKAKKFFKIEDKE